MQTRKGLARKCVDPDCGRVIVEAPQGAYAMPIKNGLPHIKKKNKAGQGKPVSERPDAVQTPIK